MYSGTFYPVPTGSGCVATSWQAIGLMLALRGSVTAKKFEVFFRGPAAPFDALFPQYVKRWQTPDTQQIREWFHRHQL